MTALNGFTVILKGRKVELADWILLNLVKITFLLSLLAGWQSIFILHCWQKAMTNKIFLAGIMVLNEFACWQKGSVGLCLAGYEERLFFPHESLLLTINHFKGASLLFRNEINLIWKIGRWALLIKPMHNPFSDQLHCTHNSLYHVPIRI